MRWRTGADGSLNRMHLNVLSTSCKEGVKPLRMKAELTTEKLREEREGEEGESPSASRHRL